MGVLLVCLMAALLSFSLYARFAPSDVAQWHDMPETIENADLTGGATRILTDEAGLLDKLDALIRATPRTEVLAGAVSEGMITYVTRSAVFGFPDYTTARTRDNALEIYGRLRFGVSDVGINAARIDGWLRALKQLR